MLIATDSSHELCIISTSALLLNFEGSTGDASRRVWEHVGSGDSHKIVRIASRCLHRTDRWHCSPFLCTRQRSGGRQITLRRTVKSPRLVNTKKASPSARGCFIRAIFVGGVYNSNFNQAATAANTDSGWSLRVAPRLIATGTDGAIHSTTLYGSGGLPVFQRQYSQLPTRDCHKITAQPKMSRSISI